MTAVKKKKKKRKRSERSKENKRKWAEKRAAQTEARKASKKIKKPAVEKSEVETKPWPRAGDNKEFEDLLGQAQPVQPQASAAESKEPEIAVLKTSDVAEWVKWPFQLWSTSQNLPEIIKPAEATEIAEPLTRVLNRHGISQRIPPDVIDGMQIFGRTVPVVKRGNDMVRAERQRRSKAGPGKTVSQAPQGAKATKPIEI